MSRITRGVAVLAVAAPLATALLAVPADAEVSLPPPQPSCTVPGLVIAIGNTDARQVIHLNLVSVRVAAKFCA